MSKRQVYSAELLSQLPVNRGLYYGGEWHDAVSGAKEEIFSPATGDSLGFAAWAQEEDVDAAVVAALEGFQTWRRTPPAERAAALRRAAAVMRDHKEILALVDAIDGGNPVAELRKDVDFSAATLEYFAGIMPSLKGEVLPMPDGLLNYTLRQPLGVVARISAFNHPMMFAAMKIAAPLAAGNAVIVKSPDQAPLSTLKLAEILGPLFPPGVLNVLSGSRACGEAVVKHSGVAKVGLIGAVSTGHAVLKAGADTMKRVTLELSGKNALVAFPDADPVKVADSVVKGMNFAWCGQSCGSTSRAFLHTDIYDQVVELIKERVEVFKPGLPTDPATNMGSLINETHFNKVTSYIEAGHADGARLISGGKRPDDPALANGWYVLPTVFADVTPGMRIADEEIFGPVLSVMKWSDKDEMMAAVNAPNVGLTASVWTNDLAEALQFAADVEVGYVWVNNSSQHFLNAPFGGIKQSGLGREECLEEMLDCTEIKNVNITIKP